MPVLVIAAWLVHLYTASSALLGLWALVAGSQGQFRLAIGLMIATLVIDSTDGALARAVRVRERIPWIDGRRLDDICDYFTYVIVPAGFLIQAGLLPHPAWSAVPLLASAYGFSQDDAKTEDHFFLGWPSYWNVVAIYLYLLEAAPYGGLALVLVFAAAVFVPVKYIYPSRTRVLRGTSVAVLAAWTVVITWVATSPAPDRPWVLASLFGPAYYLGLSFWLNRRSVVGGRNGGALP